MEKIKIINKTPHKVVLYNDKMEIVKEFPSEGSIRLSSNTEVIGNVNGIPLTKTVFGNVTELPEQRNDTIYIVSSLVCNACPNRKDLYIVNETVRDDKGRIIGCKSLSQNPYFDKKKKFTKLVKIRHSATYYGRFTGHHLLVDGEDEEIFVGFCPETNTRLEIKKAWDDYEVLEEW